jgi:tetratricopeptide (TPR) repeat protein
LADLGRGDESEAAFRHGIAVEEWECLHGLGSLLKEQGQLEEAEPLYKEAVERGVSEAFGEYGDFLWVAKREVEAEAAYREAIEAGESKASLRLGLLLQAIGRDREAEAAFRAAVDADDEDDEAVYRLAEILEDRGNYEDAAKFYALAVERGDNEHAALDLAEILMSELDRVDEAVVLIEETLEQGNKRALVTLGAARRRQGHVSEAEDAFRRAIEVGAPGPYAHIHMASLLAEQGRREEALVEYRHASEADADDDDWLHIAWGMFELNQREEAERFSRRGLEAGDVRNYRLLGRLIHERGDSAQAARLFDEALVRGRRDVLVEYGILERDLGHVERAEQFLHEALKEGDDDAHIELARLLQRAGRYPEAELEYQAAISVEDNEAHRAYGQMLVDQGRIEQAGEQFRLAFEKGDEDAAAEIAALSEREEI